MAIANEDLEAVVKNLLNQSKEEQNKEWRSMVEEMVDAKLTQVEENWKKTAAEKAKDSKIEIDVEEVFSYKPFHKKVTLCIAISFSVQVMN